MRLFVFEPDHNAFRILDCEREAQMPGVDGLRFSVAAFTGRACTDLCWTDRRALTALDALYRSTGIPFQVDCGFRRPGPGASAPLSPHCMGLAFDVGKWLPAEDRCRLRTCAIKERLFPRVQMAYQSGLSLHLSLTDAPPALSLNSAGPAVLTLQDLLTRAGLYRGALTGTYGGETLRGVRRLQRKTGLPETGRMDRRCWLALSSIDKARPECENENTRRAEREGERGHGL